MAHINVKPLERTRVYETPEQAINHIFLFAVWSKNWDFGGCPFGHTINLRRAIDAAIKEKDAKQFFACKRRGYWRVEFSLNIAN